MAKLALFDFLMLNIWNAFPSKRTDSSVNGAMKITSNKIEVSLTQEALKVKLQNGWERRERGFSTLEKNKKEIS